MIGNDKLAFVHVPKTGGNWVGHALRAAGVEVEQISPIDHPRKVDVEFGDRFSFGFVREPLSWYGSEWNFRNLHGTSAIGDEGPLEDYVYKPFPEFLESLMDDYPGWLYLYYEEFVGPPGDAIDFIGRFERLEDHLVLALELAGCDFDEEKLRSVPLKNPSAPTPECPPELRQRLFEAERACYSRFYEWMLAGEAARAR
jgi:hypothetical protein